jgi:hydrogenase nickel incorporation protein HypB
MGRAVPDLSGYQTGAERVEVQTRILDENDKIAAANRERFAAAGVHVVNLMSAPGAGKTALLRETLTRLAGELRIGIIEGDIETSLDADRLGGFGARIALINTGNGFGGECHLDAPMVRSALPRLPLGKLDLVLIENVGNLVCPAEFDVGEHARAMVYAVTEGEDKPLKYPVMFRSCELVVVNKTDLLPYLDFDMDCFLGNLRTVNPAAAVLPLSARTGDGVEAWCEWLRSGLAASQPGRLSGVPLVPRRGQHPGCGACLVERGGHHVRRLPGGRQRLDHLGYRVVRVKARLVRQLPVLVLHHDEPGKLLAQLGQLLADQLEAADDVPDIAGVGQLAAAMGQFAEHRDRVRCLAGDLARRHGARQLGHCRSSAARAQDCAGCSGIRLLGGNSGGVPWPTAWCAHGSAHLYDTRRLRPWQRPWQTTAPLAVTTGTINN